MMRTLPWLVLMTLPALAAEPDFGREVLPILSEKCFTCHGPDEKARKGKLRLDTEEGAKAVIASKATESELFKRIITKDDGEIMPPRKANSPLTAQQIDILKRWIDSGAKWGKHWAFEPVKPQPGGSIDGFIREKLKKEGLTPSQRASKETLIRRVTFDLVGLPPTPAEIDAFLNDTSEQAWEKVIDRLLASPHYGERWGRHWLDIARFAESNGYEYDEARPNAWRYRDYVIKSFNDDKPYNRFLTEQIAGDELAPQDPEVRTATGFNLLGPDMTDSSDQIQRRHNTLNDMTDTTASAFLGLTFGCARCHDHKFEPIPQIDYYRLQAFFTPAKFRTDLPIVPPEQKAALDERVAKFYKDYDPVAAEFAKLEAPHRARIRSAKLAKLPEEVREAHETLEEKRTPAQRERVQETQRLVNISVNDIVKGMNAEEKIRHGELTAKLKALNAKRPKLPTAMALEETTTNAEKTYLLERGEPGAKGDETAPGFPSVLGYTQPATVKSRETSTGRRTVLAEWITDPMNPLTARVLVNRVWHHHFGKGLVRTTSDFGTRGDPPSHPELLDWLTAKFLEGGWSIKKLHKLILMSETWQQTTLASPEAVKADPENRLLSHMNRLRLEGEIIRDALLFSSGRLNAKMGGPGVFPPIPPEALQGAKGWVVSNDAADHTRRSVYIFARRNLRFPFLEAFDLPDSNLSCPKRERSTTAPQALALLNASDVIDASNALAKRLKDDPNAVENAYRLTLGRKPSEKEQKLAAEFLMASPLSELCRALFNVNEFVYLD